MFENVSIKKVSFGGTFITVNRGEGSLNQAAKQKMDYEELDLTITEI